MVSAMVSSNATLRGKMSDQTGAGVAGAKVTVTSKETGLTRVVSTTGDGNYRVTLLPAGGYSFKVESSGFATREQSDLLLRVGDERRVDVISIAAADRGSVKKLI
jgi:hypothetical protein